MRFKSSAGNLKETVLMPITHHTVPLRKINRLPSLIVT
jgi:hypothetical protein